MFKKCIFLAFLLGMTFSFVKAQNTIGDITLKFCNSTEDLTKELNLLVDSGKEQDICMQMFNQWMEDVTLKIWFVDGWITNDDAKNKACYTEDATNENFGKYVQRDKEPFLIAANSGIEKHAMLKLPAWFSWVVHGCVTYYTTESNETLSTENAMFNVLVRKANFIDVFAQWTVTSSVIFKNIDTTAWVKNLSKNPYMKVYFDETNKVLMLELLVENDGSIDQNISVAWKFYNTFGHEKTFSIEAQKVYANTSKLFGINLGEVPFYKWYYTAEAKVNYTPVFDFDTTGVSEDNKKPGELSQETRIFLIPWIAIGILAVVIILILMLIFRKKKKNIIASDISTTSVPAPDTI